MCNRTGLHARPAAQFANAAKQFDSKVFVRNLSKPEVDNLANAKSIISILTLGMGKGTKIESARKARTSRRPWTRWWALWRAASASCKPV